MKKPYGYALFIAALAAFIFFQEPHAPSGRSYTDGALPGNEPITELFFADPFSFPRIAAPGEPIPVSFTIHNLEDAPREYAYRVYAIAKETGERQALAEGTVALAEGEYRTISAEYSLPAHMQEPTIHVELPSRGEHIHFTVTAAP